MEITEKISKSRIKMIVITCCFVLNLSSRERQARRQGGSEAVINNQAGRHEEGPEIPS